MENRNVPVVAKKVWNLVRVMYYMLRKGISKPKLLMFDLNMLMKRGKIAGKALHNLMFHHHHHHNRSRSAHHLPFPIDPRDFEFSCRNTPAAASFPFKLAKRRGNHHSHFFKCINAPATDDEVLTTVKRAFEMMQENEAAGASPECWDVFYTPRATPALAVYGRTPMVRITDSPFPVREVEGKGGHVDRAAEEFISWFYDKLITQSKMSPSES